MRITDRAARTHAERATAAETALRDERARVKRLEDALTGIAAFGDTGANARLAATGSYAAFDEPCAVQAARAVLTPGEAQEGRS